MQGRAGPACAGPKMTSAVQGMGSCATRGWWEDDWLPKAARWPRSQACKGTTGVQCAQGFCPAWLPASQASAQQQQQQQQQPNVEGPKYVCHLSAALRRSVRRGCSLKPASCRSVSDLWRPLLPACHGAPSKAYTVPARVHTRMLGAARHSLQGTTRRPAPTNGRTSKLMPMPVARAKLLFPALARERAKPKSGDRTRMGWGRNSMQEREERRLQRSHIARQMGGACMQGWLSGPGQTHDRKQAAGGKGPWALAAKLMNVHHNGNTALQCRVAGQDRTGWQCV